jgi:type I restriction enzyme S subunit
MTEGPYKLPEGWRWVRLGEVCTLIESGFAFRKKGAPEGDLLHLRPYNIAEDGTLDLSQRFYVPSSLRSARHKFLQPGDVLFNNTNSVELVGKTALVREPLEAAFSNHITLLRPDTTKAEGAWIALVLLALWHQGFFANLCNKWIGQAGINTETLRSVLIPLPPLEEQRRIVARVEELMSRIREAKRLRQEAKEEAERLWQSILSETFPKPGTELPEGWQWVRLGEVCDYKSGVWGQTDPNGIPVLRSTDFLPDGNLSYETAIRLALSEKQLKKAVLQPGDILLERSGGGPNKPVGRVAYFQGQGTYCCGNFITRLRVSCADVVPKFLFYYLFYFHISGGTESLQTQTTNIRNLRFDEYLAITVPLPPLEEQRRIVAYLQDVQEKIRALKEVQAQTEAELKRLEQAILDKAFRGEL